MGTLYIASMNMRGKWAERPEKSIVCNVTSCQAKLSKDRIAFSPMGDKEYEGFMNFEAFWQSGKRFEGVDAQKIVKWWKNIDAPKRRFPGSRDKKVLYSDWGNGRLGYVESRKQVYIPLYYDFVKDDPRIEYWRDKLENGLDVVIYDFDGPRTKDKQVECIKVTRKEIKRRLENTNSPFGHGYVVAMLIKGYSVEEIID